MSNKYWNMFLVAGAVGAWYVGVKLRSKQEPVYAQTNPVAYTAEMTSRSYDAAGIMLHSWTAIEAQRSNGSKVLVKVAIDGQPVGTKRITDTVAGRIISVDPLTQSRATFKMNEGEVNVRRSPKAVCDSPPWFKADAAPGQKLLGWDVTHFVGQLPGENLPAEWWVAPSLNCLAMKTSVKGPSNTDVLTVEKVTLGEPDKSLFEIPGNYVERRPSEILNRAYQEGKIARPPAAKTSTAMDQVYDSRK